MSRATAPRPFRTAGFQRVLDPLVPFLDTSWGMPRSSINPPAARCAADKGQKAKFQTTFSLDARTASRRAVLSWVFILCRAAKNEPRKRAKTFPLGSPWHCRSTRSKTRGQINTSNALPRLSPPRAAGGESKGFCFPFC